MLTQIINNPTEEEIKLIRNGLREYNSNFLEIDKVNKYLIYLRENELILGGITGVHIGNWFEIDFLWIDRKFRKKGYGSKLLNEIEVLAKQHNCNKMSLNTFSFQAKPFYEKHGFKVVYIQEDFPITSKKYFMEKSI